MQLLWCSYRQPLTKTLPTWHNEMMHQLAFIKVSLRTGSSSLKIAGFPTVVQNTDSDPLFVWITLFSMYISKKPYVKLSKHVDKLLVVKTLMNIRHFSWKYLTLQLKYYPNQTYNITHFSWNENYDLSTSWFFAIHLHSIFCFQ